jgi:PPOX class probable F420-dependent enzyme
MIRDGFSLLVVVMVCKNTGDYRRAANPMLPKRLRYNVLSVPLPDRKEVFMPDAIPEKYRDLFQKRAFASLATLMPDGRPQVTPVWCDFDGEHVIFNSAKGRQKDKNVRRDPRVSLAVIDPENPYRYIEIRGRIVEITEEGANEHINKMAKKYLGVDKYPYGRAGEVRVIYKIKPEHVQVMG